MLGTYQHLRSQVNRVFTAWFHGAHLCGVTWCRVLDYNQAKACSGFRGEDSGVGEGRECGKDEMGICRTQSSEHATVCTVKRAPALGEALWWWSGTGWPRVQAGWKKRCCNEGGSKKFGYTLRGLIRISNYVKESRSCVSLWEELQVWEMAKPRTNQTELDTTCKHQHPLQSLW